eukprot:TRINITY_DN51295_c0_g1_i2.p1 TRINITY_DN51295_c0_g1~~TRINITY_DN51295_c0_g1_i2.p1  ORF type:complete len:163 (+),score=21.19 TRINITY_DN51295_c0_g1_i2:174-662(+)
MISRCSSVTASPPPTVGGSRWDKSSKATLSHGELSHASGSDLPKWTRDASSPQLTATGRSPRTPSPREALRLREPMKENIFADTTNSGFIAGGKPDDYNADSPRDCGGRAASETESEPACDRTRSPQSVGKGDFSAEQRDFKVANGSHGRLVQLDDVSLAIS